MIQKEDAARLFWPYEDVHHTQGMHGGEPVRLEYGTPLPEAIVIDDPAFLSALRPHVHHRHRQFQFPVPSVRRIGLLLTALLASIIAVGVMVRWGIPTLTDTVTPWVPVSWEVALGEAALQQMVSEDQRCTDPELLKQTTLVLRRLVDPATSPYELRLTIVDSNQFNAYALPGGQIVVFRSLLQTTKSPEELASVLAHEIQHILLRHTTQSLLRDLSLAALIGAVLGDVTGLGALSIQTVHTLSTLHYNRDMEEQADTEGMRLLQRAHINPQGMIHFFETLQNREEPSGIPAYLSTHPRTEERIARLKTLLDHASDTFLRGQDEEWKQTAALCRK